MPKPADQECSNCTFSIIKEDEKNVYFCHRLPPELFITGTTGNDITEPKRSVYETQFPILGGGDWCGEHKALVAPT